METNTSLGFVFILMGAVCGGSFGLPSKFAPKETPWEVLWGPFFLFVTILIPVGLFPFVVDGLFATCREAGWSLTIGPLAFGFLWGLGSMTLGLSFAFIGLSLAYAINYGAQIAFGAMGPMLIHSREDLTMTHGYVIMAGVVICLLGVVVCGKAALLKSKGTEDQAADSKLNTSSMLKGLGVAFLSGILCACYSVAFSFGDKVMAISTDADSFANAGWKSAFVVTALILWGGAISSLAYCLFKLTKNKTWGQLTQAPIAKILVIALIMALLHDGAILFWGLGAARLGALGVGVGYAVFMSFAIIVGNINGFLTGEWKGASQQSIRWIAAGILVLILGVSILAKGNIMKGRSTTGIQQVETENP
jgi:L-rhamnose-H+ transport protein